MKRHDEAKPGIPNGNPGEDFWILRLYIAGKTLRSETALQNLERICQENLAGKYRIEVVDLLVDPQLAEGDQILAVPTLVRQLPSPIKQLIGDLSDTEKVLVGLDLKTGKVVIVKPCSGDPREGKCPIREKA